MLRSGATPRLDGGVDQHPIHDHGDDDDLGPEAFEARFAQAPATGFEPREDEPDEDTADSTTVRRRSDE